MEHRMGRILTTLFLASACQNRGPTSAGADAAPMHPAKPSEPAAALAPPVATVSASAQASTPAKYEPTTEALILRRLADHAATLPEDAIVPRIGLADLAYPRSQTELKAMGGFAAMLLTVICRDRAELPVAKVEVRLKDDHIELAPVVTRLTEMPVGTASPAYGRARFDAVYLVPVFLTRGESSVVAVLRAGARPLTVLQFPAPPDEDHLRPGLDFDWPPFQPETKAIHTLIDEELPAVAGLKLIGEDGAQPR